MANKNLAVSRNLKDYVGEFVLIRFIRQYDLLGKNEPRFQWKLQLTKINEDSIDVVVGDKTEGDTYRSDVICGFFHPTELCEIKHSW